MKGYIYRINAGEKFYIGSTSLTVEQRLKEHMSAAKKTHRAYPLYTHLNEIGWENASISIIRECEYETKRQLLAYERDALDAVMNDPSCLNINRPLITPEELKEQVKDNTKRWQQENKERCIQNLREWRKNNPEKVKEQRERRKEKAKETRALYEVTHHEQLQQKTREWRLNNPEKYAEQKRRAAEKIKAKRQLEKNSKVDTKC